MTTFTPPERWPFLAGQAVYFVRHTSWIRPTPLIPAIVLSCYTPRSCPLATKAAIQRADKSRPSSVGARHLIYRGYCEACEVPAIVGPADTLICPRCCAPAVPLPPPDHLVVRWFPPTEYLTPRVMRFQVEHPEWSWQQARDAADAVFGTAYDGMLKRLGLRRLYHSSDFSIENTEARQAEGRLLGILDAAALLGDAALFLSTHQELSARRDAADRSRYLAQRLQRLSPDRLAALLDLVDDDDEPPTRPPAVSHIPLPSRSEDDAQPDGADETTRWLEQQFRKKNAA